MENASIHQSSSWLSSLGLRLATHAGSGSTKSTTKVEPTCPLICGTLRRLQELLALLICILPLILRVTNHSGVYRRSAVCRAIQAFPDHLFLFHGICSIVEVPQIFSAPSLLRHTWRHGVEDGMAQVAKWNAHCVNGIVVAIDSRDCSKDVARSCCDHRSNPHAPPVTFVVLLDDNDDRDEKRCRQAHHRDSHQESALLNQLCEGKVCASLAQGYNTHAHGVLREDVIRQPELHEVSKLCQVRRLLRPDLQGLDGCGILQTHHFWVDRRADARR
mmetsp:Transcript_22815/g.53301  ORF Transcript_22815/g.53301 Transcript_22815/m.53301 type:complete len:274 (-) Transcript_22815:672-1493(-)